MWIHAVQMKCLFVVAQTYRENKENIKSSKTKKVFKYINI